MEITPGERFVHLIETLFGLAREGHVNKRDATPTPASALSDRVLRHHRVPQATDRRSAPFVRHHRAARPPSRLPRDLPLIVENDARTTRAPRHSRGLKTQTTHFENKYGMHHLNRHARDRGCTGN